MKTLVLLLLAALLVLVACEADPTPPPEDGPLLVGVNDMPKQVVTVWVSPTPQGGVPSPTQVIVSPTESATPEPPEPTATPTAGVGVFVGESRDGTPVANAVPPVVIPPSGGVTGGSSIAGGGSTGPGGTGNVPGSVPGGGTGGISGGAIDPGSIVPPVFLPPNSGLERPVRPYCYDLVNEAFINVYRQYEALARYLGCARRDRTIQVNIVSQTFERGQMVWREDNRDIYSLPSAGNFVRVEDLWNEGMPENDPILSPPAGLQQPVRGFGFAWRNNPTIRDSLGWAMSSETASSSAFQEFWFGFMFLANNNQVYAVIPDLRNPDTGTVYGPFPR